jgi:tripartite-type tricarboxylate transporter receptor subunit TctC
MVMMIEGNTEFSLCQNSISCKDVIESVGAIAGAREGAMLMRRMLLASLACAAASSLAGDVSAQVYPSRPITMVVPYPGGGPTDTIARIVADRMRVTLGQPLVIENVAGASGSIGVGRVARAASDGYTLSFGTWSTHVVNGAILGLKYDVFNDFEPVALIVHSPMLMTGNKAMPAKDLKGLIAWLKANPDKALLGVPGVAGAGHLAGAFFQRVTGTRIQIVPYRGVGPAIQDMIAGRLDLMFDLVANSLPHVRAGTIKAHAILAKSRVGAAPDVPTVDEAGVPGFYVSSWQAIWVPKGTAKNIVARLNSAVMDALADVGVRQRLTDLAQEIPSREEQTSEALGALQRAEIEKWWPIIKSADIKAE